MSQNHDIQSLSKEAKINLAIQALKKDTSLSERSAAKIYQIPRTTLSNRRAGKLPRRDCQPNLKKLTMLEEKVIVEYILDLDSRGFPPTKHMVRDMADNLLKERGGKPTGKNWMDNFIKRTPELKTRWSKSSTKHKNRKIIHIQNEEKLPVENLSNMIIPEEIGDQEQEGEKSRNNVRVEKHCGRCSTIGHNSRTCQQEIAHCENFG